MNEQAKDYKFIKSRKFQFLELNLHLMTMELKVINSFMFYNRYTPAVKYLPVFSCPEGGAM